MKHFFALLALVLLLAAPMSAQMGQPINNYAQNFDGMGSGSSLPTSWQVTRAFTDHRYVTGWNAWSWQTHTSVDQVVTAYPINPGFNFLFNCFDGTTNSDRALGMRQRYFSYSQTLMVQLYNDLPGPLTEFTVDYVIEKYGYGSNPDGTTVRCYYTTNANPATFSESETDPTVGWVGAQTSPNTSTTPWEMHFATDGTDTDPALSTYPMDLFLSVSPPNEYPQTAIITGLNVAPNANVYVAINISIGDPINNGGMNFAQGSQIFAIDDFSIGGAQPVELTAFTARRSEKDITLNWRTATEKNNYGFEIERAFENTAWETIGFVDGHGTINTPCTYSYVDATSTEGHRDVSYRLHQIDRDGTSSYSKVVTLSLGPVTALLVRNFPNPFNPATNVHFTLPQSDAVTLTVHDATGRVVATILDNAPFASGDHSVSFDASELPSGVYFGHLKTSTSEVSTRMVVAK